MLYIKTAMSIYGENFFNEIVACLSNHILETRKNTLPLNILQLLSLGIFWDEYLNSSCYNHFRFLFLLLIPNSEASRVNQNGIFNLWKKHQNLPASILVLVSLCSDLNAL